MMRQIGWSMLFAGVLVLGVARGAAASDQNTGRVVYGPSGQNPVLWRVEPGIDALQGAIARRDKLRLAQAGFTDEQVEKILDPAQSAQLMAPYLEAKRVGFSARRAAGDCSIYILAGSWETMRARISEALATCERI